MKILVAPLNWGLGHASRCVPLVKQWLNEGHEVVLGGDGDSLTLLRKHFPRLRYVYLAPLQLRYSSGKRQVWALAKAIPQVIRWAIQDHAMVKAVLREEMFDRVVSDNRFGCYNKQVESIYITHQLHIRLPRGWRWAERWAAKIHARVYNRFDEVWVPDSEDEKTSLSGWLGHGVNNKKIRYIGPLSRFMSDEKAVRKEETNATKPRQNLDKTSVTAVLSGLEPQRSILESEIVQHYQGGEEQVVIVQGLPGRPMTRIKRGNITMVPYMDDAGLKEALAKSDKIIARSGYSTIMDLDALGVLSKAELIPTPGQSEQEYLAEWLHERTNKHEL